MFNKLRVCYDVIQIENGGRHLKEQTHIIIVAIFAMC